MLDELFIYGKKTGLFNRLISQSSVMSAYTVSPNYGHDLNTNNLEEYVKDPTFGLATVNPKYPICVCMLPKSKFLIINGGRTERFFFTLYFLEKTYIDGQNKLRNKDKDTNLSISDVPDSWNTMKLEALSFISLLEATLKGNVTIDGNPVKFKTFLNLDSSDIDVRRLSNYQSDRISGVSLTFTMYMYVDECLTVSDGITYNISNIRNEVDPVWQNDKTNYYTKTEVNNLISAGGGFAKYTELLPDVTSTTILSAVHNISNPADVIVTNTDGEEFDLYWKIDPTTKDVYIESNTSLLNYKITIF